MKNEIKEQLYRDMTADELRLYRTILDSQTFQVDGLHLLNASVIPVGVDGTWNVQEVPPVIAYRLHQAAASGDAMYAGVASHIGHEGTAQAITSLHGTGVEVDRSPWNGTGVGLAFTLKARQREGEILTYERVMEVGFVWRVLIRATPESRRCGSCGGELTTSTDELAARLDRLEAMCGSSSTATIPRQIDRLRDVTRVMASLVRLLQHGDQGRHRELFERLEELSSRL